MKEAEDLPEKVKKARVFDKKKRKPTKNEYKKKIEAAKA
jgi:hypothetical protein